MSLYIQALVNTAFRFYECVLFWAFDINEIVLYMTVLFFKSLFLHLE